MTLGDWILNLLFYAFALIAVFGAVGVAVSKNILRSAFALLFVLFAAAALYALMKADFLFVAQILIYVGGILVLIIFAIMLTHKITNVELSNLSTHGVVPICAALSVLFMLSVLIYVFPDWGGSIPKDEALTAKHLVIQEGIQQDVHMTDPKAGKGTLTETLGYGLMTRFLLPFEVISVLLLAALIGAAFLARKEVRD